MSSRFTDRIIAHIAHSGYVPSAARAIASDMQVAAEDLPEFDGAIERLAESGRIVLAKDGVVRLPSLADEVVGIFKLNPRGFGFVIPEHAHREGDLFIPPDGVRDAISGDRVRARVVSRASGRGAAGRAQRATGRIVEVLDRGQEHFVGVLIQEGGRWFVQPDGPALSEPVLVRDPHAKNAHAGDKVVIELLHYPEESYLPEGVITRVLGEAGRPDVETEAVIAAHGLRTEFPEAAVREARAAGRDFETHASGPWPGRLDLTGEFIFTIDPPDARDFDDAIDVRYDAAKDEWTLGVHIADVAHFVRRGSVLDAEALARGNSVYLPRHVIPMLPEVLSNGVCSLQENVNRLTKSAIVRFDGRGNVLSQRLAASVIRSRRRLTYLEAQALIDGDLATARQHGKSAGEYPGELIDALRLCERLARILQARRRRDGMIVLNLPEVVLVFDAEGHVMDAVPEDNAYTHTLIEMFMVEANEAVARTFSGLNVPLLRRTHPDPVHGDLRELAMYARVARFKLPERPTRHDLQRLLDATRQTPAARAIHFAVLRTLTRASYSPALIGHYALASEHYAHFTSPIRRYPDLTVHRVVEALLAATDNGESVAGGRKRDRLTAELREDERVLDEGMLLGIGRHCSETEDEAEAAERELRDFLVMQFLHEHHMGDEFDGVITAVTGRGIFVSIERFLVEGLVALRELPRPGGRADRWVSSEHTGRLVSHRTGLSLGVGDIVSVQIAAVDLASRHMDLLLTKMPAQAPPRPRAAEEDKRSGRSGRGRSPARSRKNDRRGRRR